MLQHVPLSAGIEPALRSLGWSWMLNEQLKGYFRHEALAISPSEAEAYAEAAGELYQLYVQAGQHALDHGLLKSMGIPANMERMIRQTWDDDRHLHLYGRFDLAGGIDGRPIKLIEFNADTATSIPETAVVQWAHLLANGMDDAQQFNHLYESLRNNFLTLKTLNPDLEPALLISTMSGFPEDDTNIEVLAEAARDAGFEVAFAYVEDITFSATEGIFTENAKGYLRYPYWFKLIPWEFIAYDEPELLQLLDTIIEKRLAVVINPPYTLLFQSKAILKLLWELNPGHPLLLETSDRPLAGKKQVEKVIFGREGHNTRIIDADGQEIASMAGEYGEFDRIYQAYAEFPRDDEGNYYQAGVFFAYEPCALGFRYGDIILGDTAMFSGHLIEAGA